ncbi:hypothetical protein NIIDMKKI_43450 [Mycobacterium kansasii]|uniref:Uncharacterized protein n=1 Tax=Mycobacterium kansasii TaxID=1768 RepID=A0A7G1IHD8_MYCKA|nr:hypothetical protein NIIDMKKI_43450 [Mycobacterium kansasii]
MAGQHRLAAVPEIAGVDPVVPCRRERAADVDTAERGGRGAHLPGNVGQLADPFRLLLRARRQPRIINASTAAIVTTSTVAKISEPTSVPEFMRAALPASGWYPTASSPARFMRDSSRPGR